MANCGQYLWSTTIFILSWLAMTRAQTQCPTAPNMNVTEKLNAAQIILYGIETSQLPECQGDIGHCSRTDIDFAVHCVLKNEAGVDIPASITIRGEPLGACGGTHLPHAQTPGLWHLVVMVTRDANGDFRWDELVPGEHAYFDYSDQLNIELMQLCWSDGWTVPRNAQAGAQCPARHVVDLQWRESRGVNNGDMCCTSMGYSTTEITDSCTTIGHKIAWSAPDMLSVGCGNTMEMTAKNWTLVMADEPSNMQALSVNWLVTNIPCINNTLDVYEGTEERSYQTPWLGTNSADSKFMDSRTYSFYFYKQNGQVPNIPVDVNVTCYWCSFNMLQMVTANSLSLYSKMTLTVTRDIATAWERYIYHGDSHAEACLEYNPRLATVGDFAVCPAPEWSPSSSDRMSAHTGFVVVLLMAAWWCCHGLH